MCRYEKIPFSLREFRVHGEYIFHHLSHRWPLARVAVPAALQEVPKLVRERVFAVLLAIRAVALVHVDHDAAGLLDAVERLEARDNLR